MEEKISIGIIGIIHLVGAGLLLFAKGGFYSLTLDLVPIQLIFTTLITLKFQKSWNISLVVFLISSYTIGFISELIGVHFGWPFGNYQYGEVLGIKVFETPLMIGLNWFLLSYLAGNVAQFLKVNWLVKALAGALLMVLFDFFMEPVAMKHTFWNWKDGYIPLQNYIGWFVVSFIILLIYNYGNWQKENRIAPWVFLIMLSFFLIQNIF